MTFDILSINWDMKSLRRISYNGLIHINGMLIRLKLFHAERLENHIHYSFIFTCVDAYHIIFTQPLRSGRIWHKVNF